MPASTLSRSVLLAALTFLASPGQMGISQILVSPGATTIQRHQLPSGVSVLAGYLLGGSGGNDPCLSTTSRLGSCADPTRPYSLISLVH